MIGARVDLVADGLHFVLEEFLDKDVDWIGNPVEEIRKDLQWEWE